MPDLFFGAVYAAEPAASPGYPGAVAVGGCFDGADGQDGGNYAVTGTVAIDSTPDIPVHRRVRLICTISGRLVRETWSDPISGIYEFKNVRVGPWTVLAHDYSGVYNAVVADAIMGVPL